MGRFMSLLVAGLLFVILSGCYTRVVSYAVRVGDVDYASCGPVGSSLLVRTTLNGREELLSFSPTAIDENENVSISLSRLETKPPFVAGEEAPFQSLERIQTRAGSAPQASSKFPTVKVFVYGVTLTSKEVAIGPVVKAEKDLSNVTFFRGRSGAGVRGSTCRSADDETVVHCACPGCMVMTSGKIDHILCCGVIARLPRLATIAW